MKTKLKSTQEGSVLLEVMISILIFSFGILGIVGLQAAMISSTADAKYRTEAGFFANRLLGEMMTANRASVAALAPFATGGASYTAWYNDILNTDRAAGQLGLPGAIANPPAVVIAGVNPNITGLPTSYNVTVTVFWQSPGQPVHRHVVSASLTAD